MSTTAVEHTPAPAAPAVEPARADAAPRPSPAPEGRPAVRLLDNSPAPPANVPREVGAVLHSPGPGEPLPASVAAPIGTSLGVDVSPVRVHADAPAAGAAEAVSARAFTYGTHVFLGPGERATDLPLVSHEVAHVVQQQGSPAVQLFGGGPDPGPLEHEAQRASAAVTRGETAVVAGRTTPAVQRQFGWLRRAAGAVAGAVRTVAGAVAEGVSGLLDRAVNFIKERARSIPGYDLVAFALGRDPITQQPVERNAYNLIRAVVSLIPGGAALFQTLEQSGALQRAFEWATSELARLGLTWTNIRTAVSRFLDSLGPADLLNLGGVFERARAMFGPLLSAAVRFAAAAGRKLLEFVFEAVMASAGGQRIVSIFRRIGETFSLIVSDPVRFLSNLLNAVKGGFQRFAANIIGHLRTALFEWLLGALRGALTLPSRWDFAGIMSVILQILGLTWQALRGRLVRLIGDRAVSYLETAFDFIRTVVTRGVSAAWDKILEFATGLIDTVIEGIRNWVARSIVGAAVTRLVTMFNPVGAIIQSIIAIYNTVMFFVERAQQIAALVDSIVDSIANIASGNIGAAVGYVERTMARFLPVLISFLARLIGLGNVSGTIREIIGRIRGVVDRAIDRVIDWVVARVRPIIARLTGRQPGPDSRSPEEKMRDLRAGVGEAERVLDNRELPARERRTRINAIKEQYRLNELAIVTDRREGIREQVHVRGMVNPTYDSAGHIVSAEPLGKTVIQAEIGGPQPRLGFEEVLEPGPAGYQRAHLLGAGFGVESPLGVLYAPTRVNQQLQNRGIEGFIRELYRTRVPGARLFLEATAVPHPPPRQEYLGRVVYKLSAQIGSGPVTEVFEFRIMIQNRQIQPQVRIQAGELDPDALRQVSTRAQTVLDNLNL